MKSVNFVVLGDQSIAGGFGKKGTETDLTMYDRKEQGIIRTWVAPNGFPERIQPLIQAINMSEFAVLHITALDRFAGEQIVALDMLGKGAGILSHSYEVDENTLDTMIRGTVVGGYARTAPGGIGDEMARMRPVTVEGRTRIVIDHCFDVKGVGTVALGRVAAGSVSRYDVLKLLPSGAEITVKSIQMHDEPVETAACPARVGLSLKGVRPEEVGRGDILCEDGDPAVAVASGVTELDFARTPYYRGDVAEGQMCMVGVGLKIAAGKISSVSPFKVRFDKPVAYGSGSGGGGGGKDRGDTCVVLKPESDGIRILGSGRIK